jgi:tetratricopeptide (TPR) repeat protein
MGNHRLAINDFNSAIQIDEKFAESYYRRGLSELESKNFKEAIKDFKESLRRE